MITRAPAAGETSPGSPRRISRRAFLWMGSVVAATGAFLLRDELLPKGTSSPTAASSSPSATATATPAASATARAQVPARSVVSVPEYPVSPYISKAIHLDSLPWNSQSFYKQPWRGYLETVSGQQFLAGIGINYNLPGNANHEAAIKLLSDCGFKAIRLEVGWVNVPWSEAALSNSANLGRILAACQRNGVTPLILLNANQGIPGPNLAFSRTIVGGGIQGSRQLQLDDVTGLVAGRSGISNLTTGWMAEALFTSIDPGTKTVTLSKPLPKALPAGSKVAVHTLKYLPLYPAKTPQFEETVSGWLKYVDLIMRQVKGSGLSHVEIEIWNELSFGSAFLNINNYYQPALVQFPADWLQPGGQCWELAHRTIDFLKASYPGTKVIWGFSNTSFFHTPATKLPSRTDGQSYHPYGTSKRMIPRDFPPVNRYSQYIEHFIPSSLSWCMPEGWAHLGVQTEFLPRLLNPAARGASLPPGTQAFSHYLTEHGFLPTAAGIKDRQQAMAYKAKATVRALMFWLNKGITRMHIYSAYDPGDLNMGLLFAQPEPKNYGGYLEQQLISPALQAVRNVVGQFAGAQPLSQPRPLTAEVAATGTQSVVFAGGSGHPPLPYREMVAFLPFQVNPRKFVCAVYLMAYDVTNPPAPMTFRIRVRNIKADARVSYYDPILGRAVPVTVLERQNGAVRVQVETVEYPRLLIFNE